MRRFRRLLGAVLLLFSYTACDPSPETVECSLPPESALEIPSEFELVIEPNPVAASNVATVSVNLDGPERNVNGGLQVSWECWDGDAWAQTHIIVRASDGLPAAVIDLSTDSTVAIPDIGLPAPNSHEIIIPPVDPGIYRITDYLYGPETSLTAHEIVEVVDSQD